MPLKVTPTLHEKIHREAADRGISIVELLKTMFEFFMSGGYSHLLKHEMDTEDYAKKERIWREDLADLIAENEAKSP